MIALLRGRDLTGVAVFTAALLLYLPCAGSYGLWDPWETHYGEVARQMTTRGDYISLWWPGSPRETPTFQTKPVLSFWLMSLSMRLFGVGLPGGPPDEMALGTRAEWAVRTPFCLLAAVGLWAIYLVTARLGGRRAGLFAAASLAGFPMYALVARQAMTDMAFVALMTLALGLAALALAPAAQAANAAPTRGQRLATLALFALATVPQLLIDSLDLRVSVPWAGRTVKMYGIVAMAPYWLATAGLAVFLARARRRDVLALAAAATLAGLAVLAKGLAGLALPVVILLAYVLVSRLADPAHGWGKLADRELCLALAAGLLIAAVVAVPWHHAMYVRHGAPWWNELFGDNHWRRLMIGRHGERGTFVYFLRQLGHGTWPLVALCVPALAHAALALRRPELDPRRRALLLLGVVWFVTAYAVVSLSMTKFHHYLLPALPGLAILIGCLLDDLVDAERTGAARQVALLGVPALAAVTYDLVATHEAAERFLWLFSYDYVHSPGGRPWPAALDFRPALLTIAAAAALCTAALAVTRLRPLAAPAVPAVALAAVVFLLDGFMPRVAHFWSQKGTIARYFRERRSPAERLVAYQVFWRGETFYTKNAIFEGPPAERTLFDLWPDLDDRLRTWIANHRGQRHFFLLNAGHEARLRALLPADAAHTFQVLERSNNKFVLAVAEL